jgi:hypothetical protein
MDVAALKEHLPEDLTLEDEALGRLLDSAREAVEERLGPTGDVTERFRPRGRGYPGRGYPFGNDLLRLSRRALGVVSITENTVELDPEEYLLQPSGRVIERVGAWWSRPVYVTYTPVPDLALRETAMIALVKLDISHSPGLVRQEIEGWSETYRIAGDLGNTYTQAREDILASLRGPLAGIW